MSGAEPALRTWQRVGLSVEAPGGPLTRTHAMLPSPLLLEDRIRVLFAACDADLRGRIFFADLEREPPYRVLTIEERPALDLGAADEFDCDGVNPSQLIHHDGELLLLYIGWRRDIEGAAPYTLLAGLAVSRDGGCTFQRRKAPLLPRTSSERLFRTAPFARRSDGAWELLYISGSEFILGVDRQFPLYRLVRSRSRRLEAWPDKGEVLLEPNIDADEIGFGRPVLWDEGSSGTTLLLSRRTRSGYELEQTSYADLAQGRASFVPVLAGPRGAWEADMTCFGAPLRVADQELLFYNGDRFGRTGFGLASRPHRDHA